MGKGGPAGTTTPQAVLVTHVVLAKKEDPEEVL